MALFMKRQEGVFSWKDTGAIIIATFKSLWVPFLLLVIGLIAAIILFNSMFS
jgi:hypothetical protein